MADMMYVEDIRKGILGPVIDGQNTQILMVALYPSSNRQCFHEMLPYEWL